MDAHNAPFLNKSSIKSLMMNGLPALGWPPMAATILFATPILVICSYIKLPLLWAIAYSIFLGRTARNAVSKEIATRPNQHGQDTRLAESLVVTIKLTILFSVPLTLLATFLVYTKDYLYVPAIFGAPDLFGTNILSDFRPNFYSINKASELKTIARFLANFTLEYSLIFIFCLFFFSFRKWRSVLAPIFPTPYSDIELELKGASLDKFSITALFPYFIIIVIAFIFFHFAVWKYNLEEKKLLPIVSLSRFFHLFFSFFSFLASRSLVEA